MNMSSAPPTYPQQQQPPTAPRQQQPPTSPQQQQPPTSPQQQQPPTSPQQQQPPTSPQQQQPHAQTSPPFPSSPHSPDSLDSPASIASAWQLPSPASSLPPPPPQLLHNLDFSPSTLAEFLALPYDPLYRYELIDGILHRCTDMANFDHNAVEGYLFTTLARFNDNHRRPVITVHRCPRVAYRRRRGSRTSSTSESVSTAESRATCLVPDLAIGPYISEDTRDRLSPTSYKVEFPLDKPSPYVVIEITSSNRGNDLVTKVEKYAEMGVEHYVVVDRHLQCIWVYKFYEPGDRTYDRPVRYNGDQIIPVPYLESVGLTANRMLHPPRTAIDVILSPVRARQRAEDEARTANARASTANARANTERRRRETVEVEARTERRRRERVEDEARTERRGRERAEDEARTERRGRERVEDEARTERRGRERAEARAAELERRLASLESTGGSNRPPRSRISPRSPNRPHGSPRSPSSPPPKIYRGGERGRGR